MSSASRRKLLLLIAVIAAALVGAVLFVRPWLGGRLIRTALGMAGATDIRFRTVQAVPSRVVVEDLEFRVRAQVFAARRLTLDRPRWWRMTLGKVHVEGARAALTVDGSDTNPWQWTTFEGETDPAEPASLPVESVVLDGEVTVRAAGQPERRLTVKLEGSPKSGSDWVGSLVMDGPGFKLAGRGTLVGWGTELDFQVHRAELDLETWQGVIQRRVFLPGGPWKMSGHLTGVAEGRVTAKRFAATARVSLREGRMQAARQDISADGAEVDLEFSDLWKLRTKAGSLRVKELRVGRLPLTEVNADIGLWGAQTLNVARVGFAALGARVETGSFRYFEGQQEMETTLQVTGLDLGRLRKLMPEVEPTITGRVDGTLPVQLQETGVRLASGGQLALMPGAAAELEFDATALVRSGTDLSDENLTVLRSAGIRPVRLQLAELRLAVRPPGLPLGCSARLYVAGQTPDGPLSFEYDVNGSIEKYLDILTVQR